MAARTHLRFTRPAEVVTSRLAAMANRPLIEMACPVWPSVAPRPCAIGVSRLMGMNSEAISRATHRVMDRTAPQAATGRMVVSAESVAWVMARLLTAAIQSD